MSKQESFAGLPKALLKKIYLDMLSSRLLEEALIRIYKAGQAYFWIGGPGEENFSCPLGHLVDKGHGPNHDWLHLHYRSSGTLVAMGMSMKDPIRNLVMKKTDPFSGGRNFVAHYCVPQWNVAPVTSVIEVQYLMALGTAWVQKQKKAKGITIVTGGDAGANEGDFASCLVWASRVKNELPMLITVQNNQWGISTSYESNHGSLRLVDRGKAFSMKTASIGSLDPIEAYIKLQESMNYIRKNCKPVLLEVKVSRLYGHSSASGANFITEEEDPLLSFEKRLLKADILKKIEVKQMRKSILEKITTIRQNVDQEIEPSGDSIWDHVYANNENSDWRNY